MGFLKRLFQRPPKPNPPDVNDMPIEAVWEEMASSKRSMGDLAKVVQSRETRSDESDQPANPIPPQTDDPIAEYKTFIDALNHPSLRAQWVRECQWRDHSVADSFNEFLSELRPEQRELVAQMVELAENMGTWQRLSLCQLKRGGRLLGRLSGGLSVLVKSLAQDKTVQRFQ